MAISWVGGVSARSVGNNTNNLTPTLPSHQADDFAIAVMHQPGTQATLALTVATGWTAVRNDYVTPGVNRVSYVWTKKFTSASETDPVFTTDLSDNHSVVIGIFRGVDTATQLDVTEVFDGTVSNTDNPSNPAITTVTDNAAVVLFMAAVDCDNMTAHGEPSGYTLGTTTDVANSDEWISLAYNLDVGAFGTETPGVWTHTTTGNTADPSLYTFALRPAAESSGLPSRHGSNRGIARGVMRGVG